MTDPQPTFASEADPSEPQWRVPYRFGSHTIQVPVTPGLIRSEISDQASVKGSNRKGVLRTTRKRLAAALKQGQDNLSEQARGEMEWNAFILLIDEVIGNRHMAVRTDPDAVEQIASDPRLKAPEEA